jgi:hypothetical protein
VRGFFIDSLAPTIAKSLPLAVFSFLLTPKEQGHAHLILGGIDPHYEHGLTYIPVAPASHESHYWQLESSGIKVNGKTTKSLKKKTEFIIDTGNSGLGMPKELTEVDQPFLSLQSELTSSIFLPT